MKAKANVDINTFFKNILDSIPEDVKQSIDLSMAIASQINSILKKKNISQREFANLLGKKESEISKWLAGNHNFTTNTLGKIQSVLKEEIIQVPIYAKKEIKFIPFYSNTFKFSDTPTLIPEPVFDQEEIAKLSLIINCNADCHATNTIRK